MLGRIGFFTGLTWAGSFLLAMLSLKQPVWGFAGNILGVLTIWIAGWQIRAWQEQEKIRFGIRHRWHICLASHLLAALICTFTQYIYLRYLDNGQMMTALTNLYSNPEYASLMSENIKDYDPSLVISTLQKMTLGQLTMEFLILNSFIALVLSLPTMLVAKTRDKQPHNMQQK